MSELRYDPLRGRWVNINPARADRPTDFGSDDTAAPCPFCPGNEARTTSEVYALRPDDSPPDSPGWSIRVVRNIFPALRPMPHARRSGEPGGERMDGVGAHEVLIESPDHDATLDGYDPPKMQAVLIGARTRLRELERDPHHAYAFWFRNTGQAAGMSLSHPHSQILACPMLPDLVRRRILLAVEHFRRFDEPIAQPTIDRELARGDRVVFKNDGAVTITPFASGYPYEMAVHPRTATPCFAEAEDATLHAVGRALGDAVRRLRAVLGPIAYNVVLQTAPNLNVPTAFRSIGDPAEVRAAYGWHLEVVPRVPRIDGFEWSVGLLVNPVTPEHAAEQLRSAIPNHQRR